LWFIFSSAERKKELRMTQTERHVEWVALPDGTAVVSRETGEYWFLELADQPECGPFATPMTGKGTCGSTGALLAGAVERGFAGHNGERGRAALSLPKFVFDLVFSYHNAHRAPGHFRAAARRFRELDRPEISAYLETHAREETGHDRLVIKDLRALGLPAERIVANLVPEAMSPLCDLFDEFAASDYPIGCIGYSYCFEYTAAFKGKPEVEAFAALCPPGADALRFSRTHSCLGSEAGHVDDIVEFVAGLPANDRSEIVKATYRTALRLSEGVRSEESLSDAQISADIQAAAGVEIRLAV
jgi:hypothetical protein